MAMYVALLRGVNVGGKNKVSMSELRSQLASLGLEDVVTYVQSGNVVFRGPSADHARRIEQRIAETFGVDVRVLLRTPSELGKIAEGNPFMQREPDPVKLHVVFLDRKPTAKAVAQLDPARSPPDDFVVRGREIYLHLPDGAGRSKLTIDYFERQLGMAATARNWKTVLKLVELTSRP